MSKALKHPRWRAPFFRFPAWKPFVESAYMPTFTLDWRNLTSAANPSRILKIMLVAYGLVTNQTYLALRLYHNHLSGGFWAHRSHRYILSALKRSIPGCLPSNSDCFWNSPWIKFRSSPCRHAEFIFADPGKTPGNLHAISKLWFNFPTYIISTEQAVSKQGTSSGMTCKHVFTSHSPSHVPLHLQTKMSAARWMHTLVFKKGQNSQDFTQQLRHSTWHYPKTQPCLCQKLWRAELAEFRAESVATFASASWRGGSSWAEPNGKSLPGVACFLACMIYVCFIQVFWKSYYLGWFEES